ncbi:SAC3/GANP/Nin1/mts3/eIF-3 p25 family-domain-containing protein [Lipomyces oligophaga]|uniref:SAC3/GANP/Nin1/mts3/eIF-3 p25 family-domain-containing protein n=1 Tax=Lipomyces oligophaga TaxID=45792 RepID=UPI0034CDAE10
MSSSFKIRGSYRPPQSRNVGESKLPVSGTNPFQTGGSSKETSKTSVNHFQNRSSSQTNQGKFAIEFRKSNKTKKKNQDRVRTDRSITASDGWDAKNQAAMNNLEASWNGDLQSLYEKFQEMREVERTEMEKRGLVDSPDIRKNLEEAIVFVGTCTEKCPLFERVRRSAGNLVKSYEKGPDGLINKELAIKEFSRPAAGQPPPLPSDVRPPGVLQETLTFLIDNIVPQLPESHAFLWDRTRSIRQDFTYQNYSGYEAIDCNERIARIHIIALHSIAGEGIDGARQQELEQFNKALQTLSEFYSDARKNGAHCPNEAEFQAYRLLSLLRDPDIDRQIQELPTNIFLNPKVQIAMELRNLAQQNNIKERGYSNTENAQNLFVRFFKLVKSSAVPFLMGCLAEIHFNDIRLNALRSMSVGYHKHGKPYVASNLAQMLGCNDLEELFELCDYWEIPRRLDDGIECVDVVSFNEQVIATKAPVRQAYSTRLVQTKLQNQSITELIQGNNIKIYPQNAIDQNIKTETLFRGPDITPSPSVSVRSQSTPLYNQQSSVKFSDSNIFGSNFGLANHSTGFGASNNGFGTSFGSLTNGKFPTVSSFGNVQENKSAPAFSSFGGNSLSSPSSLFKPDDVGLPPNSEYAHAAQTMKIGSNNVSTQFGTSIATTTPQATKLQAEFESAPSSKKVRSALEREAERRQEEAEEKLRRELVAQAAVQKVAEQQRRLSELAATQQRDEIVETTVKSLVRELTKQAALRYSRERSEIRHKLIDHISEKIFRSLVYDKVWSVCQEMKAVDMFRKSMLLSALRKIRATAALAKANNDLKKRRREQYRQAAKIMGRPLKKKRISLGRRNEFDYVDQSHTIQAIDKEREMIEQLWLPVNLEKVFLPYVEATFNKKNIAESSLDVDLLAADWQSPTGIWFRRKLLLEWNGERYSRLLKGHKLDVSFSTMTAKPESYELVGGLIFLCGMNGVEHSSVNAEAKLQSDGELLLEALRRLKKYSRYNVSLLVCYWPFDGISSKKVGCLYCLYHSSSVTNIYLDVSIFGLV